MKPICRQKKVKSKKYNHKKSNWITFGLLESLKHRDKLYKQLKKAKIGSPRYNDYKTSLDSYNQILRKTIRLAKSSYCAFQFEKYKSDIRKTWDTLKLILNKNKRRTSPEFFMHNNVKFSDPKEIANQFNNFFTNVGVDNTVSNSNSGKSVDTYLKQRSDILFNFDMIDDSSIFKMITKLETKDSYGYDKLSTRLLKYVGDVVSPALRIITNQSLISGIFPEKIKISKVMPLYKKDDATCFSNYRPISLLP